MDFLHKLDFMMEKYSLNKRTLSQHSGIPYTTIDGWYKKGYEGMKLSTLRVLSDYFNTVIDFWVTDEITDPNAWKANGFVVNTEEMGHVQKYRLLDPYGKEAVDGVLGVEFKRCDAARQVQAAVIQEQKEKIEAAREIAPEIKTPTPVSESGLEVEKKLLKDSLSQMNPDLYQMYFDQMRKLKEPPTEALPFSAPPEADRKAPESGLPDQS